MGTRQIRRTLLMRQNEFRGCAGSVQTMIGKHTQRRPAFSFLLAALFSTTAFLGGPSDGFSPISLLGVDSAQADHDSGNGKSQHGNSKQDAPTPQANGLSAQNTSEGEIASQKSVGALGTPKDRSSNNHVLSAKTRDWGSREAGDSSDVAFGKITNLLAAPKAVNLPAGPPLALLPPASSSGVDPGAPLALLPKVNDTNVLPDLPGSRPDIRDLKGHPLALFLEGGYEPKDILITVSAETTDAALKAFAAENGLVLQDTLQSSLLPFALVRLSLSDGLQVHEIIGDVEENSLVMEGAPNYRYGVMGETVRGNFQFAPQRMNVGQAHEIATGKAIKIAVIDTGIDANHKELKGSVTDRFDAVDSGDDASKKHGTAIAGVIAAKSAMTGIAPDVNILSAKAFAPSKHDDTSIGTSYDILKSMDWAYRSGAQVFNLSFAGPKDSLLIKALDELSKKNAIMIGAAGNAGPGKPPAYPAAHPGVIAVTATDQNDDVYKLANRGSYIAVAAPGVDILTTTPGDNYGMLSGTSIATAHVSGVVALLLERDPKLKSNAIAELLARASIDLGLRGVDPDFGAGLIDAYKALKSHQVKADFITSTLVARARADD